MALSLIKMLYAEGGIEICTFDNGDNSKKLLIRTVIQPDADIITHLSKDALNRPVLCESHHNEIIKNIQMIRRLRFSFAAFVYAIRYAFVPFVIASGYWKAYVTQLLIAGVSLTFISFFIIPLTGVLLKRYLSISGHDRQDQPRIMKADERHD